MVKKVEKTKEKKKSNNNKKEEDYNMEEIETLKKDLLSKPDTDKKEKKVKTTKKKKKEKEKKEKKKKEKEKKEKKKKEKENVNCIKKITKNKSNNVEEKKRNEDKDKDKDKDKETEKNENDNLNKMNGGELSLKKNNSKNKLSTENKKNLTLLDMIKSKPTTEIKLVGENSGNSNRTKSNQRKKNIQNKELAEKNISTKNQKEEKEKNEYIKQLKPQIIFVDGKMVVQKPDLGLVTKKYNEETNKNSSPKEAMFVSKEENVINSLSFLKIEHTKKWTEEETQNFYKALELFGLDFSFLAIVLAPRKREEIKRKYLKEKKQNPEGIERLIYSRKNMTKWNKVLNLYKKQNVQKMGPSHLALSREASLKLRKNESSKEEVIDFNKEYNKILNK